MTDVLSFKVKDMATAEVMVEHADGATEMLTQEVGHVVLILLGL